jgi:hypothetical protein
VGVDTLFGREAFEAEAPQGAFDPQVAIVAPGRRQRLDLADGRLGHGRRERPEDFAGERAAVNREERKDVAVRFRQGSPERFQQSLLADGDILGRALLDLCQRQRETKMPRILADSLPRRPDVVWLSVGEAKRRIGQWLDRGDLPALSIRAIGARAQGGVLA